MKTSSDLNKMTLSQIVNYFNSILEGKEIKGFKPVGKRGFNTKSRAIERTMALQKKLGEINPTGEFGKVVLVKERGFKMALIRSTILSRKSVSRVKLAEMVGSTEKNVHIMISILCNANRVQNPISVSYNKSNRVYTLVEK